MLRDVLGMTGTKFGCGMAQCGACTVQIDGEPVRSCLVPIGSIGDRKVTTIEGIGAAEARREIQKVTRDLGAQVEVQGGVKAGDRVIRRSIFRRAATCVLNWTPFVGPRVVEFKV